MNLVPEWQDKLALLIVSGKPDANSKITDDSAGEALYLIRRAAGKAPFFLLKETNIAVLNGYKSMATIVVAMLFLDADESFLSLSEILLFN